MISGPFLQKAQRPLSFQRTVTPLLLWATCRRTPGIHAGSKRYW